MRALKFRAWDGKEMKPAFDLTQNPKYWWEEMKDFPLMQFTGLHDKNGVEIYEGDVYHQGDPRITYTVVWHDTGLIGKQNGSSSYAGLEHWQDRIEIIGNIFTNPELLEVPE